MSSFDETTKLEQDVLDGNASEAVGQLMVKYQDRLQRVIAFRMDRRLKSRIDAADVVQEAFVEATRRLDDYRACADKMSFFLWLRFITLQKLAQLHRHHLGVQARNAARDVPIFGRPMSEATSMVLAAQLLGNMTSPSYAAMRRERQIKLDQALAEMEDVDREVLALRHFEHLNNQETAQLLDLSETAASNRYVRALRRLKSILNMLDDSE